MPINKFFFSLISKRVDDCLLEACKQRKEGAMKNREPSFGVSDKDVLNHIYNALFLDDEQNCRMWGKRALKPHTLHAIQHLIVWIIYFYCITDSRMIRRYNTFLYPSSRKDILVPLLRGDKRVCRSTHSVAYAWERKRSSKAVLIDQLLLK